MSTNYRELNKAAKKAECWPDVRLAALHYLETGQSPVSSRSKGKGKLWPLPAPEVELPSNKFVHSRFPDIDTLINIAILEQRFDDVVDLYQRLRKTKRWGWETDKKVAHAVAPSRPAVALGIWLHLVDGLIGRVKPSAYEEAAVYLRLMEEAYAQLRRQDDWHALLEQLRREHKAKRRLMSVLDILSKRNSLSNSYWRFSHAPNNWVDGAQGRGDPHQITNKSVSDPFSWSAGNLLKSL